MRIKRVPFEVERVVLVCVKCFERTQTESLVKPLKKALKPLRTRVVGTTCLGVCPKGATVIHDPRHPREWMIVKTGTPVDDVVAALVEPIANARSGGAGDAARGLADQRDHVGDALRAV